MKSKILKSTLLLVSVASVYLLSNTSLNKAQTEKVSTTEPAVIKKNTPTPIKKKGAKPQRLNSIKTFFARTTKKLPDLIGLGSLSASDLKIYGGYGENAQKVFKSNKKLYIKTYFKFLRSGKLKANPSAAYLLGEVILNNSTELGSVHDRFVKIITPENVSDGLLDLVTTSILDTYVNDEGLLLNKLNALQKSAGLYYPEEDLG